MRIVAEYRRKAAKFDDWARASSEPILMESCADLADCYQCLASKRQRLLEQVQSSRNCRKRRRLLSAHHPLRR
jgi:hypothetical protein